MGNITLINNRRAKAHSNAIDRDIERASMKFRKECSILLLGLGESGKSTIVNQMKIKLNGFTRDELLVYRMAIYRNLVDSAQAVILAMRKIGIDCETPGNSSNCDRIIDYCITTSPTPPPTLKKPSLFSALRMRMMLSTLISALASLHGGPGPASSSLSPNADPLHLGALPGGIDSAGVCEGFVLDPEIASLIYKLWQDPAIPTLMARSSEFDLMDNVSYFFTEALRIGERGYVPTEMDVLRAHQKTTETTETRFNAGQLSIRIVDICGQRSERKWIHCFESATSMIFCAALSEYDQTNRLAESLALFESVVNSRWFVRTSIVLVLTKVDVFQSKLPKAPLEKHFPDYAGGPDVNKAAKYILWRFMQANRARLSVYPHLMHLTDTTNAMFVVEAVRTTILQNALKDSGIL